MNLNMKRVSVSVLMFLMAQSGFCGTDDWFGRGSKALVQKDVAELVYYVAGENNPQGPVVPGGYSEAYENFSEAMMKCVPENFEHDENFKANLRDALMDLIISGEVDAKETVKETVVKVIVDNVINIQDFWRENDIIKSAMNQWLDYIGKEDVYKNEDNLKNAIKGLDVIGNKIWRWGEYLSLSDSEESDENEVDKIYDRIKNKTYSNEVKEKFLASLKEVMVDRINTDLGKVNPGEQDKDKALADLENALRIFSHRQSDDFDAPTDVLDELKTELSEKTEGEVTDGDVSKQIAISVLKETKENFHPKGVDSDNEVFNFMKTLDAVIAAGGLDKVATLTEVDKTALNSYIGIDDTVFGEDGDGGSSVTKTLMETLNEIRRLVYVSTP